LWDVLAEALLHEEVELVIDHNTAIRMIVEASQLLREHGLFAEAVMLKASVPPYIESLVERIEELGYEIQELNSYE